MLPQQVISTGCEIVIMCTIVTYVRMMIHSLRKAAEHYNIGTIRLRGNVEFLKVYVNKFPTLVVL